MNLTTEFLERLCSKLLAGPCPAGTVVSSTPCWIWGGAIDRYGYGVVRLGPKMVKVHRAMYTSAKGPVPRGLVVDHLCRVRSCVNPKHLQAVTIRENLRRGREARCTS